MRIRRSGAVAVVGAAIAIAAWLNPSFDLGYRGDTVAIAAPEAAGNLATLLDQVKVVDRINDVPGYERSCKRGDAPLTEPTAQSAQV